MHEHLKDGAREAFRRAMSDMPGRKTMVVDASVRVLLDVLSRGGGGKAFFDNLGVTQILVLDPHLTVHTFESSQVVFLVRPEPIHVKHMADNVLASSKRHTFMVAWLPQCNGVCALEMERQGIAGTVGEVDIPLFLVPCDDLVWSMCWEGAFIDLFVFGDSSVVTQVVRSLLHLEQLGGLQLTQRLSAYGAAAHQAKSVLDRVRGLSPITSTAMLFDQCLLMDRQEDPISMLVTPLHYEGLLDTVIGLDHGAVSIAHDDGGNKKKKKHVLQDDLFKYIRDMDFQVVTSILHDMSTSLQADVASTRATETPAVLTQRSALAAAKVNLSLHVNLAHRISRTRTDGDAAVEEGGSDDDVDGVRRCVHAEQTILERRVAAAPLPSNVVTKASTEAAFVGSVLEEELFHDPPLDLAKLVKLMCLHCLVQGGYKASTFEWLQTQLCHTYGHPVMLPLLAHLRHLNWLFPTSAATAPSPSSSTWKKKLRKDVAAKTTTGDITSMFSTTGYAPISVRHVQDAVKRRNGNSPMSSTSSPPLNAATNKQRVLVYYIGGITVAEVAAYRLLNQAQDQVEYVVACTAICNTARLLRQLASLQT